VDLKAGPTVVDEAETITYEKRCTTTAALQSGGGRCRSGGGRYCPGVREACLDACYERSRRSLISATGSVDPRDTSPAPYPPENVPPRPRVLPQR
jgi:hypothetical protein